MRVALAAALAVLLSPTVWPQDASPPASPEPMVAASAVTAERATPEPISRVAPPPRGGEASPEIMAAPVSPEPTAGVPTHDEAALTLLEEMAAIHGNVETAEGSIRQVKYSVDFLEEIETTGRFVARRPNLFRFDYDPSDDVGGSVYWVLPDEFWIYMPELNQAEVIPNNSENSLAKLLSNVVIGLGGAVEQLRSENWITLEEIGPETEEFGTDIAHLLFTPRGGVDDQGVTQMEAWIDLATLQPVRLKFIEESGDETTLTITSLALDVELEPGLFDPRQTIPQSAVIEEIK